MSEIIVALLLWGVVVSVAVSRAPDSDRSILISSAAIAASLTFNIDALYLAGDELLGGTNKLEIVADLALIVGVSFLLRGLLRATRNWNGARAERWQAATLIVVCSAIFVEFLFIDAPQSSTTFMIDFGAQPAAAAYSITQYMFLGVAMLIMGWMALRHIGEMPHLVSRASLLILSAGCVFAVALSGLVVAMDLTHVTGNLDALSVLSAAYGPLNLGAIAFLCVGNAIPPIIRRVQTYRRRQRTSELVREISPVWESVVDASGAIAVSQYGEVSQSEPRRSKELMLHRMIVEIRDATSGRRGALDPAAHDLLRRAEDHLLDRSSSKGGARG